MPRSMTRSAGVRWVWGEQVGSIPRLAAAAGVDRRCTASRARRRSAGALPASSSRSRTSSTAPSRGALRRSGRRERELVLLVRAAHDRIIAPPRARAREVVAWSGSSLARRSTSCPTASSCRSPRRRGRGRAPPSARARRRSDRAVARRRSGRTRICCACSTRSRSIPPSGGLSLVLPGYPTPHEEELRGTPALGRRRRHPLPGWVSTPARRPLRGGGRFRPPVAARRLRAAGARGDGARLPVVVSDAPGHYPGCGRRQRDLRSAW